MRRRGVPESEGHVAHTRRGWQPKTEIQAIFDDRSGSIYGGMVARASEKRSKAGCVLRARRAIPFTLPEFRGWLMGQLLGSVSALCDVHTVQSG